LSGRLVHGSFRSEYDYIVVYPKYSLTMLGTNIKEVMVLLGVDTSTTALSEVSKNRVVKVIVEI
jgi:hypothetical protein